MDMSVRVDNLTNEKYSTYATFDFFYPAAGIAVRSGVSYRF
jgi:outer membrane receptor protein involved in Fe transport